MGVKREDLSNKIKIALDKAIQKVIAETKAKNSYMVISDKKRQYHKDSGKRFIAKANLPFL